MRTLPNYSGAGRNRSRRMRRRRPTLPIEWGSRKYSRRAYRAICDIPLDIPKEELDRRIKAFGGNHFGMTPTIHLHGIEFRAVVAPSPGQPPA